MIDSIIQLLQNADFSQLRGLRTGGLLLSFAEKKGTVKATMIDTDALIKMIKQGFLFMHWLQLPLSRHASHIT